LRRLDHGAAFAGLFDLAFLEHDMLPRHGIVFLQFELVGRLPGILLLDVEIARVGGAYHFDQNGGRFRHDAAILWAPALKPVAKMTENTRFAFEVNGGGTRRRTGGGYAALAGVTAQHGLYRCAASYGGLSDMHEILYATKDKDRGSSEHYADGSMRYWQSYVGPTRPATTAWMRSRPACWRRTRTRRSS
jgi:hypothetical protein